jgi:hypothetical protein
MVLRLLLLSDLLVAAVDDLDLLKGVSYKTRELELLKTRLLGALFAEHV